jgi:hypothetical protein
MPSYGRCGRVVPVGGTVSAVEAANDTRPIRGVPGAMPGIQIRCPASGAGATA